MLELTGLESFIFALLTSLSQTQSFDGQQSSSCKEIRLSLRYGNKYNTMVSCLRDLLCNACLSYLSSDNESYVKRYRAHWYVSFFYRFFEGQKLQNIEAKFNNVTSLREEFLDRKKFKEISKYNSKTFELASKMCILTHAMHCSSLNV